MWFNQEIPVSNRNFKIQQEFCSTTGISGHKQEFQKEFFQKFLLPKVDFGSKQEFPGNSCFRPTGILKQEFRMYYFLPNRLKYFLLENSCLWSKFSTGILRHWVFFLTTPQWEIGRQLTFFVFIVSYLVWIEMTKKVEFRHILWSQMSFELGSFSQKFCWMLFLCSENQHFWHLLALKAVKCGKQTTSEIPLRTSNNNL